MAEVHRERVHRSGVDLVQGAVAAHPDDGDVGGVFARTIEVSAATATYPNANLAYRRSALRAGRRVRPAACPPARTPTWPGGSSESGSRATVRARSPGLARGPAGGFRRAPALAAALGEPARRWCGATPNCGTSRTGAGSGRTATRRPGSRSPVSRQGRVTRRRWRSFFRTCVAVVIPRCSSPTGPSAWSWLPDRCVTDASCCERRQKRRPLGTRRAAAVDRGARQLDDLHPAPPPRPGDRHATARCCGTGCADAGIAANLHLEGRWFEFVQAGCAATSLRYAPTSPTCSSSSTASTSRSPTSCRSGCCATSSPTTRRRPGPRSGIAGTSPSGSGRRSAAPAAPCRRRWVPGPGRCTPDRFTRKLVSIIKQARKEFRPLVLVLDVAPPGPLLTHYLPGQEERHRIYQDVIERAVTGFDDPEIRLVRTEPMVHRLGFPEALPDGMHFSPRGHQEVGDLLAGEVFGWLGARETPPAGGTACRLTAGICRPSQHFGPSRPSPSSAFTRRACSPCSAVVTSAGPPESSSPPGRPGSRSSSCSADSC